jgi:hypothetical protein
MAVPSHSGNVLPECHRRIAVSGCIELLDCPPRAERSKPSTQDRFRMVICQEVGFGKQGREYSKRLQGVPVSSKFAKEKYYVALLLRRIGRTVDEYEDPNDKTRSGEQRC